MSALTTIQEIVTPALEANEFAVAIGDRRFARFIPVNEWATVYAALFSIDNEDDLVAANDLFDRVTAAADALTALAETARQ